LVRQHQKVEKTVGVRTVDSEAVVEVAAMEVATVAELEAVNRWAVLGVDMEVEATVWALVVALLGEVVPPLDNSMEDQAKAMEPTPLPPLVATEGDMAVATVDLEVAIMPGAMEVHDTTEGIKVGGGHHQVVGERLFRRPLSQICHEYE